MSNTNSSWRNWGDHPFVVIIVVLAAIATILTFVLGQLDLRALFSQDNKSTVTVLANQDWLDTGIPLSEGNGLGIARVSGLWTFDRNLSRTDATGQPGFSNPEASVPSANLGSLVAKIGDGAPFLVNNSVSVTAHDIGNLMLRINDTSAIGDNEGSIVVEIIVKP